MAGRIAYALGRTVALVGYRLAPEHPFPAAFDDARRGAQRLSDRGPLILGGDSAGANLALGVSHLGLAEVPALLLAYPFLDLSMGWSPETRAAFPEDWARLDAYRRLYLAGADPDDPRASPASLGAPPVARVALALADRDPLAEEARAFAADARRAGVEVFEHIHPRTRHGFLLRDDPPSAVDRLLTDFAAILATRDSEPRTAGTATEGHHE
ncbi:alpha/beta hydrolase [Microbacterium sp. HD4P20]|nr:alpha/beta hydrolase [Microbacterium sp. HD4P20]